MSIENNLNFNNGIEDTFQKNSQYKTLAMIPVTIDYIPPNTLKTQDFIAVDDILRSYKPVLFPPIVAGCDKSPKELLQETRKPVLCADELVYRIIMKFSRRLEEGNRYFWSLPVLQEIDGFGRDVGQPFILTKVEPTVSRLYR